MAQYRKTISTTPFTVTCDGSGHWLNYKLTSEATISKIEVIIYFIEDLDGEHIHGEVIATHTCQHGMPYTDAGFEKAVNAKVQELIGDILTNDICGSEQGMQGDDTWSGDISCIDTLTPEMLVEMGFSKEK